MTFFAFCGQFGALACLNAQRLTTCDDMSELRVMWSVCQDSQSCEPFARVGAVHISLHRSLHVRPFFLLPVFHRMGFEMLGR